MNVITFVSETTEYSYYIHNGHQYWHGKFIGRRLDGSIAEIAFYLHDKLHGETAYWDAYNTQYKREFYVNGKRSPAPPNLTVEEKTLFLMQYPDFKFIEG